MGLQGAKRGVGDAAKVVNEMNPKKDRAVMLAGALWLVLYFAARITLEASNLHNGVRIAVALLPVPVFAWFLWTIVQWVMRSDELERRIQLEALAVAFPLTLLLIMTLALMQIAIELSMDDWSYRHIWPILYVFYFVGLMRARRRYA